MKYNPPADTVVFKPCQAVEALRTSNGRKLSIVHEASVASDESTDVSDRNQCSTDQDSETTPLKKTVRSVSQYADGHHQTRPSDYAQRQMSQNTSTTTLSGLSDSTANVECSLLADECSTGMLIDHPDRIDEEEEPTQQHIQGTVSPTPRNYSRLRGDSGFVEDLPDKDQPENQSLRSVFMSDNPHQHNSSCSSYTDSMNKSQTGKIPNSLSENEQNSANLAKEMTNLKDKQTRPPAKSAFMNYSYSPINSPENEITEMTHL